MDFSLIELCRERGHGNKFKGQQNGTQRGGKQKH